MDIVEIALLFHGKEYKYGGNFYPTGLDCSGFVCEVLRSIGYLGRGDLSAQGIFNHLKERWPVTVRGKKGKGAILFFGVTDQAITHVAIQISDLLMIEAGGGDTLTNSILSAEKNNAYVRIRPITNRGDLVATFKKD